MISFLPAKSPLVCSKYSHAVFMALDSLIYNEIYDILKIILSILVDQRDRLGCDLSIFARTSLCLFLNLVLCLSD